MSRRPQLQERMGKQIGDTIENAINSKGVMVVIEAEHMCMVMRGIKKPGAVTKTIYSTGLFQKTVVDGAHTSNEKQYLALIHIDHIY